jgi:hypothetical protein
MKGFLVSILVLCAVAGCAAPTREASGPEAYCERQAEQDPEVTELSVKNMAVGGQHDDLSGSIRLAKRRALQRCLREKGVPLKGGVEPLAPR